MIATHSVGSLIEENKPGDFILLDQLIDRTHKRDLTYYDNQETSWPGVYHACFGDPYDIKLRQVGSNLKVILSVVLGVFCLGASFFKTLSAIIFLNLCCWR